MVTKITLFIFLVFHFFQIQANIPVPFWSEDFSTGQLPSGWVIEHTGPDAVPWQHCSDFNLCPPITFSDNGILPNRRFQSLSMSNGFAYIQPFGTGSSTAAHSSYLTAKAIDCSNKPEVFLSFNTFIIATSSSPEWDAVVEVKQGEFGTWTAFTVFPNLNTDSVETDAEQRIRSYNGQYICLDISSLAAGQEDVFIRWRWDWVGDNEYFWMIDDVNLHDENPLNERAVWGDEPGEGDFSGGLNGWTVPQTTGCLWQWDATGLIDFPDLNSRADAYSCSCSIYDGLAVINPTCTQANTYTELVSPIIDLSGYTGNKRLGLIFNQSGAIGNGFLNNLPVTSVMVSVDGGDTFVDTSFLNLTEPFSKPFCNQKLIVLPDETSGSDQLLIKFVFAGNTFFWAIDDVRIVELFDYDLKISSDYFSVAPNYSSPSKVRDSIGFAAEVQNVGNLAHQNSKLLLSVRRDDTHEVVFADTLLLGEIEPGDTISDAYFPTKFFPPSDTMSYTALYEVIGDFTDEDFSNNIGEFQFEIGGQVFSKQKDSDAIDGGFTPAGNNLRYEIGNCFFIPPGSGAKATGLKFAMANASQLAPTATTLRANLYKWKTAGSFADQNGDLLANDSEYEKVGTGLYVVDDETLRLRDVVDVPFNEGVNLEDSAYYFVTIEYFAPATLPNGQGIPFFISASEAINYTSMFDQTVLEGKPQYVSMLRAGASTDFQVNPWGLLRIPYVQMVLDDITSANEVRPNELPFSLYPNPTSGQLTVLLPNTPSDNRFTLEIYDICARLVETRQIASPYVSQLPIDVSHLSNGLYTLRVVSGWKVGNKFFVKTE